MDIQHAIESFPFVILFYTPDRGWGAVTQEGVEFDAVHWLGSPWAVLGRLTGGSLTATNHDVQFAKDVRQTLQLGNMWSAEWRDGQWIRPLEPNIGMPYQAVA